MKCMNIRPFQHKYTKHLLTALPLHDFIFRVNSHSSFSLRTEDASCVTSVKFLLSDSTESLVIGVSGVEGGKVQCWDLQQKPRTVHKLFCASSALGNPPPRVRNTPEWVFRWGINFLYGPFP